MVVDLGILSNLGNVMPKDTVCNIPDVNCTCCQKDQELKAVHKSWTGNKSPTCFT